MNKYRFTLILLCIAVCAQGKVTLPSFFTDNMVIQQNSTLTLPGKAAAGKQVTVKTSWDNQKYKTKAAADGSFTVQIPTPAAGGPYQIMLSDGETLILRNVMAGEVWFCSGQSNMEMPVAGWGKVMNYEQEIAEANYPFIRLLQVKKTISLTPQDNVAVNGGGWQECSPSSVPEFSSVAYFYARQLWKELNVPVGVIDCTWGGTPAEAWTSFGTLMHVMGFQDEAAKMKRLGFSKEALVAAYQQEMQDWRKLFISQDAGFAEGAPQWISTLQAGKDWKPMELPGYWEGKGLDGLDGVVWFQKEIEIPADWEGKEITLSLGTIDDEDITYFNGKEIVRSSGFATPRMYKVPAANTKVGKGIITVRVFDSGGEGGIYGKPESLFAEVEGQKISLAGDWNYRIGVSLEQLPSAPISPEGSSYLSVLYNGMVNPFTIFPVKGVIWYQGESNVGRDYQYSLLFRAMIADWRKQWKQELSFYFVQLANFLRHQEVQPGSKWAALREAQADALSLGRTGMISAIDIGEAHDIHPKNKQEVGRRLAVLSLADTYGKGTYDVPAYLGYRVSGNKLILNFDREVKAAQGESKGFIIAGPDMVFYQATATIRGKEVILESQQVKMPIAARYGWADNPECNLYGTAGLPVAPFRTDK